MKASEKLQLAAKIAHETEKSFPSYTEWFNQEKAAGRVGVGEFATCYKVYEAAKMFAAKKAIALAFA